MTKGLDLPSYMCSYTINALTFVWHASSLFCIFIEVDSIFTGQETDVTTCSQGSQTFWTCATYTNLHLIGNCTVIFYSAFLHVPKWKYQTSCFWLLIIYHPLKVLGFPISRSSPDPADKRVHIINHAAKKLSHRKQSCHISATNWEIISNWDIAFAQSFHTGGLRSCVHL